MLEKSKSRKELRVYWESELNDAFAKGHCADTDEI